MIARSRAASTGPIPIRETEEPEAARPSHRGNPDFGLLCDAVASRRLVVVTGSGVSVALPNAASGETLPTWYSVLLQLRARLIDRLDAVNRELDVLLSAPRWTADYLIEAATLIRETVGPNVYRDAVVELTRAPAQAHSVLHDLIEELQPLGIMTFNYDLGHENAHKALRRSGAAMRRALYSDEHKLRALIAEDFQSRFLLKAHGCISRPAAIVLDRASYRDVMARQLGYRAFAHHILTRFTALIVGFGLNDPDFEDLLQSVEADFGGGVGEHVYIWKRGQREDEEARALVLRRRYGFACIFVDSYEQVRAVIADARSQVGPRLRRTISSALKSEGDAEESRKLRRAAHLELGRLSAVGALTAAAALREVAGDASQQLMTRAEAAYSLGKIRPTAPATADFLFELIETDSPPPVVVSSLAALLQLDPPVDRDLERWTRKAKALETRCLDIDHQSAPSSELTGPPRAQKYLEALIARWSATGAPFSKASAKESPPSR